MLSDRFNGTYLNEEFELPIGNTKTILNCLNLVKKIREISTNTQNNFKELQLFFSNALIPYYDCMWSGMDYQACNMIYRLSDTVPQELRIKIKVYPYKDDWTTLENFRTEWEKSNPQGIPPMCNLFSKELLLEMENIK